MIRMMLRFNETRRWRVRFCMMPYVAFFGAFSAAFSHPCFASSADADVGSAGERTKPGITKSLPQVRKPKKQTARDGGFDWDDEGEFTSLSPPRRSMQLTRKLRFDLDLSLGSYVTTRAFQTNRLALDGILDGRLGLGLSGETWALRYRGGLLAFLANNQLTGQHHRLSLRKDLLFPQGRGKLFFGGRLLIDDRVDYFEAYDRIRSEAYLGVLLHSGSLFSAKLTSTTGYAHYFQTNEFGHVYQRLALSGLLKLPTKTMIRMRAAWTFRFFTITPENMRGSPHIDTEVNTSHRLRLSLSVAQALGRQLSLHVWGHVLPQINDGHRFHDSRATTMGLGIGEDALDGLNVIHGGGAGIALRWRPAMAKGLSLSLFGRWTLRRYLGHAAVGEDGLAMATEATREDMLWDVGLRMSWRLPIAASGFWRDGLFLNATYLFRHAQSNDARYAFQQHLAYLGISTRW